MPRKADKLGAVHDIAGWEDGIPDFGPPATAKGIMGKPPPQDDAAKLARANAIRAQMGEPPLPDLGSGRRNRGRKPKVAKEFHGE